MTVNVETCDSEIAQNTNDLLNSLGTVSADKTAVGFGIERAPDSYTTSANIAAPNPNALLTLSGGINPPFFTGSDPASGPSPSRERRTRMLPVGSEAPARGRPGSALADWRGGVVDVM